MRRSETLAAWLVYHPRLRVAVGAMTGVYVLCLWAVVAAPRVLESPVNFECRVSQILQLQSAGGSKIDTFVVFGEVVAVHIDRALIVDDVYDTAAAHPITRLGRMGDYAELRPDALFEMRRPR